MELSAALAPALIRRAFCFVLISALSAEAAAPAAPPELAQIAKPDAAEAAPRFPFASNAIVCAP